MEKEDAIWVSIIVPAYNEEKVIGECLQAIMASCRDVTSWEGRFEVIVSNNNSSDNTAEIAENHGAKVVFEPENQIARARNTGAAAAKGEWLVFIDADTRANPQLFQKLAQTLELPRLAAGGGRFHMETRRPGVKIFLLLFSIFSYLWTYPGGGFLFCRKSVFNAVGGFSQELFAAEEIFLFREIKKYVRSQKPRHRTRMIWNPIIETSPRKLNLYSMRELGTMLCKAVFRQKSTLASREDCHVWYDGRR